MLIIIDNIQLPKEKLNICAEIKQDYRQGQNGSDLITVCNYLALKQFLQSLGLFIVSRNGNGDSDKREQN